MIYTNEDRLRLRREVNKIKTQLDTTIHLHEAVSMQVSSLAASYEAKQTELNCCELALAPKPFRPVKIEIIEDYVAL